MRYAYRLLDRGLDRGYDVFGGGISSLLVVACSGAVMRLSSFLSCCAVLLFGIFYTMPQEVAYAQSAPQSAKVGAAVLELILEKEQSLGYKSLDAIVQATASSVTGEMGLLAQVAAQTESQVLGSVVSATEFGAILNATAATPVGLGIGLLVQPTSLGDDSLVKWQQGHDAGVISVTVIPLLDGKWQYYEIGVYDRPFTETNQTFSTEDFASLGDAVTEWMNDQNQYRRWRTSQEGCAEGSSCDGEFTSVDSCDDDQGRIFCTFSGQFLQGVKKSFSDTTNMAMGKNGGAVLQPGGGYAGTTSSMTVTQALSSLPDAEKARPMDEWLLAHLADALWKLAAQQAGYSGVPYPSTNPITFADVSNWVSSNPSMTPTVGDLTSPISVSSPSTDPSGGTSPGGSTGTSGGTNPSGGSSSSGGTGSSGGTNPASGTQPSGGTSQSGGSGSGPTNDATENLCQQDPGIVACQGLGAPPDAPALPSSSATVSLSPVPVGGPSNPVCPLPASVNVLGYTLTFSYQPQCDFMVRVKPFLLAMCGVVAAGIFVAGLKS